MALTRVKVSRLTLIDKLQQERARVVTEYEKAVVEYDQKLGAFMRKLEEQVETFAVLLGTDTDKAMERVTSAYDGGRVAVQFPGLREPNKPSMNTQKLDKMIVILEAASDETISIAADDDYARYL